MPATRTVYSLIHFFDVDVFYTFDVASSMSSYRMLSRRQSVPTVKPWYSLIRCVNEAVFLECHSFIRPCSKYCQFNLWMYQFVRLLISTASSFFSFVASIYFYMSTFFWGAGLLLFRVAARNVCCCFLSVTHNVFVIVNFGCGQR